LRTSWATHLSQKKHRTAELDKPPGYPGDGDKKGTKGEPTPIKGPPPSYGGNGASSSTRRIPHTNAFIEAARVRARDEVGRARYVPVNYLLIISGSKRCNKLCRRCSIDMAFTIARLSPNTRAIGLAVALFIITSE
jgi:hypothetical protein